MKKAVVLWAVAFAVGLYTTLVLQMLWNWFVARAFNIGTLSYFQMFGLQLLAGVLVDRPRTEEEQRWKIAFTLLEACVPEERKEDMAETMKGFETEDWIQASFMVAGKLFSNTAALVIGWAISSFI